MSAWHDPATALILLPLAWATLAFVLGPGRGAWMGMGGLASQTLLAVMLARSVMQDGPRVIALGGWGAPLGIELSADGLAAVFLLLTQIVALVLAPYSRDYFRARPDLQRGFWPLFGYLIAALNALFLSSDLFNLYVTLELLTLAAVGLVALGGGRSQAAAAWRYLLVSLVASGAYLMGVGWIYGLTGTVSLTDIRWFFETGIPPAAWLAGGLMLAGLIAKTALLPFHFWLPPAHGGAAAPVSALLSALVIKASFYIILRFSLDSFSPLAQAAALPLGAMGALAIVWGSIQAIRTPKIKMLVAWSTVAQLGYLFLVFPLLADARALEAGVMQAVAHGLAKAAMFAAVGVLVLSNGRDTLAGLLGAAHHAPLALGAFALAGISLMGLPPSGGFLAKWLILEAALAQGAWYWAGIIILGGLLAAAYVFRVLKLAFMLPVAGDGFVQPSRTLAWMAMILALMSILIGLRGVELIGLATRQ